jgi:hypothetical protein
LPQIGKSALKLTFNQAVKENLPPSLALTIPNLPAVQERRTCAVLCSGNTCKPPVHDVDQLTELLRAVKAAA